MDFTRWYYLRITMTHFKSYNRCNMYVSACNLKMLLLFVLLVFFLLFLLFLLLLYTGSSGRVAVTLALLHHQIAVVLITWMCPGRLARGEVKIVNVLCHILAVKKKGVERIKLIGLNMILKDWLLKKKKNEKTKYRIFCCHLVKK